MEAHEGGDVVAVVASEVLGDLAVECPGGVEEQQRVAGRCGVDDDEFGASATEQLPEGLEHGDLL